MRPQDLVKRPWAGGLALFLINAWIAWPLFTASITEYFGTVDPFFYAFADGIQERWPGLGWWPYWNLGLPADYIYQPLLHYFVAAVSALSGATSVRAFHATVAVFYCCGPVALYFLVFRLTRSMSTGFQAGFVFSLLSPASWLMPQVAGDLGGRWLALRLHSVAAYANGPYVSGLTLLIAALFFLDRALDRGTARSWVLAAIALASVPLTNIPATVSLATAVIAYSLALDWRRWLRSWPRIVGAGICGYVLFSPWLSPSSLLLMARNVGVINPEGQVTAEKLWAYAVFGAALVSLVLVVHWFQAAFYVRFTLLFTLISSGIVLLDAWFGIAVISQPQRFHLAMEIGLAMLVALVGSKLVRAPRMVQAGTAVVLLVLASVQVIHLRQFSENLHRPIADVTSRSEYQVAQWLANNANGARAIVPGSTGFWLNYWTDVPQLSGCCTQNSPSLIPLMANYELGSDDGAGDLAVEISLAWLRTLGIRYVNVSSEGSTEPFHDFRNPLKFEGVLPERWRQPGDVIYEVPGVNSLAHAVLPEETVTRTPVNGIDIEPLETYSRVVTDPERDLEFAWLGESGAVIRGEVLDQEQISVQISYHPGWRAWTSENRRPESAALLSEDALGMLLIDPDCDGACEVHLEYTGGTEAFVLAMVSGLGWLCAAFLIFPAQWSAWIRRKSAGAAPGD